MLAWTSFLQLSWFGALSEKASWTCESRGAHSSSWTKRSDSKLYQCRIGTIANSLNWCVHTLDTHAFMKIRFESRLLHPDVMEFKGALSVSVRCVTRLQSKWCCGALRQGHRARQSASALVWMTEGVVKPHRGLSAARISWLYLPSRVLAIPQSLQPTQRPNRPQLSLDPFSSWLSHRHRRPNYYHLSLKFPPWHTHCPYSEVHSHRRLVIRRGRRGLARHRYRSRKQSQ